MRLGLKKLGEDIFDDSRFILSRSNERFSKTVDSTNNLIVSGFVANELNLSGGNTFTSPMEDSAMVQKGMKVLGMAKIALAKFGGNAGGSVASLSRTQSELFYTGSQKPVFNVEAVFITMDAADTNNTALANVNKIMELVYPTGDEILTAPLGYVPSLGGGKAKGTISLRIGRWFHARNLVVKDVAFTMSKEITANGTPLFAVGTITLEPYRIVNHKEYKSWFRQ